MNENSDDIEALRALAHPLRLRMLSLLTGAAMSAAEVARELEITHANASYHLKVLHQAGEVVTAGEEKIRGGTARRYRYDASRVVTALKSGSPEEHLVNARSTALEIERRLGERTEGPGHFSDLEAWVPVEAWHRALDMIYAASMLLHDAAQPPRTADTIHVSATTTTFTMTGGLEGEGVRWVPPDASAERSSHDAKDPS